MKSKEQKGEKWFTKAVCYITLQHFFTHILGTDVRGTYTLLKLEL